jgi:hypothetical protein
MIAAGTAMSSATAIDNTISSSVTGSRMSTSASTGRPVRIELPQSPRASLPSQITYCTMIGLFRPYSSRALIASSSVKASPRSETTGSPGTDRIITNTTKVIISTVGTIASSRFRR